MAFQTSVSRYFDALGPAGSLSGAGHAPARTYVNSTPNTGGVWDIAWTAANSTAYTFTVFGITITYTSDGSATDAEIQAGLLAAFNAARTAAITANANHPISRVTATVTGADANELRLIEATPSEGSGSPAPTLVANVTVTVITARSERQSLNGGEPVALAPTLGDRAIRLPNSTADVIVGVVQYTPADANIQSASADLYPAIREIPVIHKGPIVVVVEENVTAGDPVFVRVTASGALVPGGYRNDADSSTAIAMAARFLDTATAGNKARIDLNIP